MIDFSEIYKRAEPEQIVSFLLYGVESVEKFPRSLEWRLQQTNRRFHEEINALIPEEQQEELLSLIFQYTALLQDIYMELGLLCGLKVSRH